MDAKRIEKLKETYALEAHSEGGWFSEVYTAAVEKENRALAGSIYFLLVGDEISHFHQIDCEEIWYHHEGCSVKITSITDGKIEELCLGQDIEKGEICGKNAERILYLAYEDEGSL